MTLLEPRPAGRVWLVDKLDNVWNAVVARLFYEWRVIWTVMIFDRLTVRIIAVGHKLPFSVPLLSRRTRYLPFVVVGRPPLSTVFRTNLPVSYAKPSEVETSLSTCSSDRLSFVFVVDRETVSNPEFPILVVDLRREGGRGFRTIPSTNSEQNSLSIANMDFFEIANAVEADGVFRGFRKP